MSAVLRWRPKFCGRATCRDGPRSRHSLALRKRLNPCTQYSMVYLDDCPPDLARNRFNALYRQDSKGRLVTVNEWDGKPAPRLHMMRTAGLAIVGFRADLPESLVA